MSLPKQNKNRHWLWSACSLPECRIPTCQIVENYFAIYMKPGLTGWWACNGCSDIEYDERLDLEYYYVTHCSLYLDALCVLRTVLAVFKKAGAK